MPLAPGSAVSDGARPLEALRDLTESNLAHLTGTSVSVLRVTLLPHLAGPHDAGGAQGEADEFAAILSHIAQLHEIDADKGPTAHALTAAVKLLAEARSKLDAPFPSASASTTDDGGVHVYWERLGRSLLLSVPADGDEVGFIYHRGPEGYGADKDVTATTLARWIHWLAYE